MVMRLLLEAVKPEAVMKFSRMLLVQAALFGTFTLCAYGQQENDPTWYDPWAKPAAHVTKVAATGASKTRKIKVVSQDPATHKKAVDGKALRPEATERAALVRK